MTSLFAVRLRGCAIGTVPVFSDEVIRLVAPLWNSSPIVEHFILWIELSDIPAQSKLRVCYSFQHVAFLGLAAIAIAPPKNNRGAKWRFLQYPKEKFWVNKSRYTHD